MLRNLEHTGGLFFSEAVLLALVRKGMARQAAYELVQKHALAVTPGGQSFRARLGGDSEITSRLAADELDQAFDLEHHLRFSGAIIDRALRDRGSEKTQR